MKILAPFLIFFLSTAPALGEDILIGEMGFSDGTPARLHLTDERSDSCPPGSPWFVATARSADGKYQASHPLCWDFEGGADFGVTLLDTVSQTEQIVRAGIAPGLEKRKYEVFMGLWGLIDRRIVMGQRDDLIASEQGTVVVPPVVSCSHQARVWGNISRDRENKISLNEALIRIYSSNLSGSAASLETEARLIYNDKTQTPAQVQAWWMKFCRSLRLLGKKN